MRSFCACRFSRGSGCPMCGSTSGCASLARGPLCAKGSRGSRLSPGPAAAACPFCILYGKTPTLTEDYAEAAMVLFGAFKNGEPGTGLNEGTTDFEIETVVKSHDLIKDKKVITLPRYIGPTKSKFLVFIG